MARRPRELTGRYDEIHELGVLSVDYRSIEELYEKYVIAWTTTRKQSLFNFRIRWPPNAYDLDYLGELDIRSSEDMFLFNLHACEELLLRMLDMYLRTGQGDVRIIEAVLNSHHTLIVGINEYHCPRCLDDEDPYDEIQEDFYTPDTMYELWPKKRRAILKLISNSYCFRATLPLRDEVERIMVRRYESIAQLFNTCEAYVYRLVFFNINLALPYFGFMRNHATLRDEFKDFRIWFRRSYGEDALDPHDTFIGQNDGRPWTTKQFVTDLMDTVSIMYRIYNHATRYQYWPNEWRETIYGKYLKSIKMLDHSISILPPRSETGLTPQVYEEIKALRKKLPVAPKKLWFAKLKYRMFKFTRSDAQEFVRQVDKWFPPACTVD